MSDAAVKALGLAISFNVRGVPVVVTLRDEDPIACRGIWATPTTEQVPVGMSFQRVEARRVMMLRRIDVPSVPRGTRIVATLAPSTTATTWEVDGVAVEEDDHVRVFVKPVSEE